MPKRKPLTCAMPECIARRVDGPKDSLCPEHNRKWLEQGFYLVWVFGCFTPQGTVDGDAREALFETFLSGGPLPQGAFEAAVKARAADDKRVSRMFKKLVRL